MRGSEALLKGKKTTRKLFFLFPNYMDILIHTPSSALATFISRYIINNNNNDTAIADVELTYVEYALIKT